MKSIKKIGYLLILIGVLVDVFQSYLPINFTMMLFFVSFLVGSGVVLIFVSKLKMWKE